MDCGYMLPSAAASGEVGENVVLCVNQACGVASPPGQKNCQPAVLSCRHRPAR
jgi:hypothetical protein